MKTPPRPLLRKLFTYAAAIAALAVGGLLVSWPASAVYTQQQQSGLQPPALQPDRSDKLTQQLAFFSLGGLRSLVAEVLTLDATDAWSKRDWPRVQRRWESATTLSPHRVNYWINAATDMTSNAAGDIAAARGLSWAERLAESRAYINRGEQFLLNGIANNPDSWRLHVALAEQYANIYRRPQFSNAAKAFQKALQLGAPSDLERPLFYSLCRTRGKEQEAWQLGRRLFEDEEHQVPALRFLLFVLQNKIQVPADEALSLDRLYRHSPQETEQEVLQTARKEIQLFLNNDLLYPVNGAKEFLENTPLKE